MTPSLHKPGHGNLTGAILELGQSLKASGLL